MTATANETARRIFASVLASGVRVVPVSSTGRDGLDLLAGVVDPAYPFGDFSASPSIEAAVRTPYGPLGIAVETYGPDVTARLVAIPTTVEGRAVVADAVFTTAYDDEYRRLFILVRLLFAPSPSVPRPEDAGTLYLAAVDFEDEDEEINDEGEVNFTGVSAPSVERTAPFFALSARSPYRAG